MTRFARAKGSKSSNKREPEEATPWSQMKEGLINKTAIINNAYAKQEEVQKHKDLVKTIREEKSNVVTWSTFDEDNGNHNKPKKEKKKKKEIQQEDIHEKKIKKDKKKNVKEEENVYEVLKTPGQNTKVEKAKKRTNDESHSTEEVPKKKDKKSKKEQKTNDNNQVEVKEGYEKSETPKIERNIERKGFPLLSNLSKNKKKMKDGFKSRRKPVPEPFKMDINGLEVDIVRYDGFPVMKSDADRLDELKKKLFNKGISKDEIKKIMKLERRNAEKALSRAKKRVCFNCRKSGHNLSECPVLNQGEGTGICFKCGSTEHTHFECKVTKKQEFKFAQCFICKEQGHISNQCPDNPRGLYPKGGACKLCGDVTHLKRFCPSLPKETDVTIGTFLGDQEDTEVKKVRASQFSNQNNKKHVRF